jgi:hypothetical protein
MQSAEGFFWANLEVWRRVSRDALPQGAVREGPRVAAGRRLQWPKLDSEPRAGATGRGCPGCCGALNKGPALKRVTPFAC